MEKIDATQLPTAMRSHASLCEYKEPYIGDLLRYGAGEIEVLRGLLRDLLRAYSKPVTTASVIEGIDARERAVAYFAEQPVSASEQSK